MKFIETHILRKQKQYQRKKYLRYILLSSALVLLGLLFVWPQAEQTIIAATSPEAAPLRAGVVAPKFLGKDKSNQPVSFSAKTAEETPNKKIMLNEIIADIVMKDGTWLGLKSVLGTFTKEADKLELAGPVTLYQDNGNAFSTKDLTLDLTTGHAHSNKEVVGQGPFGAIKSTGLEIANKGEKITFMGKSNMLLNAPTKTSTN